jgi:hypothetical protein
MSQSDLHLRQSASPQHVATPGAIALEPLDAVEATLAAMEQFPLVAIGEINQLQELHNFYCSVVSSGPSGEGQRHRG